VANKRLLDRKLARCSTYWLTLDMQEVADICFIDGAICRVAKQLAVGVNRGLRPEKDQPATMV
jgi:hypothetical protein